MKIDEYEQPLISLSLIQAHWTLFQLNRDIKLEWH